MELSIPSHSLKDFTAVLKCFKSFSDYLHIQPTLSHLKLSAVSPTRSTYALAKYDQSYFDFYRAHQASDIGIIEVAVKPLYKILSQKTFTSSIESCHISINTDQLATDRRTQNGQATVAAGTGILEPSSHNRLKIQLYLSVGIIKSFSLQYSISRALNPIEIRSMNSPNYWICQSTSLKQWIDHFVTNPNLTGTGGRVGLEANEEISFCYHSDGKIVLKTVNLSDDSDQGVIVPRTLDIFAKGARQVSTALTISSYEFEDYNVNFQASAGSQVTNHTPQPTDQQQQMMMLTVSMKEFRSILELGTVLDAPVDAGFSVGGRPFYISIANGDENLTMDFILASTGGEELSALDRLAAPLEPRSVHSSRPNLKPEPLPDSRPSPHKSTGRPTPGAHSPSVAGPSRPARLFRPPEEDEANAARPQDDAELGGDELDLLDPGQWEELEQQAIVQSQARDSQRQLSQQNLPPEPPSQQSIRPMRTGEEVGLDEEALEADEDRLMPSQAYPGREPKVR
ncbi:hypothetical protein CROQUDRAFT_35057 [Cronartium quercuum f. sp. fusiforme G11]|uniref:DNA repair protein rad9 n=1 Tax=Cronartium quercuum f. sp. fusiforme G11 TaxID=708437 RepID=A0A9P6NY46_9BASI|nr:hypothetical protein CROQUDRAFT_35057 [Cronartium quercuum f. sp. fusiforme G11]